MTRIGFALVLLMAFGATAHSASGRTKSQYLEIITEIRDKGSTTPFESSSVRLHAFSSMDVEACTTWVKKDEAAMRARWPKKEVNLKCALKEEE